MTRPGFAPGGSLRPLRRVRTVLDVHEVALAPDAPIREAVRLIDDSRHPLVLVLGLSGELAGTVTDGELRQGLLYGLPLEAPVSAIMNREPKTVRQGEPAGTLAGPETAFPIVDQDGRAVGLEIASPLEEPLKDRWVVIMAGGYGRRLYPLTESCPKPLLKIGGRPLLELILENLRAFGLENLYFCVNYKAAMIQEHFGDGSRFGVRIEYVREETPLGTAGALSLLPERPASSFFVMNADLLTNVDFGRLLTFHEQQQGDATLCVYGYDLQIPYGIVQLEGSRMTGIREQPVGRVLINAGIYVLEPSVLDLVPWNQPLDMPSLFDTLLARRRPAAAFPIREYWLDVGRMPDLERANAEYQSLLRPPRRTATAGF
jgi:dTDP-glucose pyrophosphorylase